MRTLETYRQVARGAARATLNGRHSDMLEDGEQEGMIAIWRELSKGEEISDSLAYVIARRRCLSMLDTGHMFGHERSVTFSCRASVTSLERLVESGQWDAPASPVDDVVLAVRQVLDTLPEDTRRHVFSRFWLQDGEQGQSQATGLSPRGNRLAWRTRHVPRLRSALAGVA